MPRIEADTGQLSSAGASASQIAQRVAQMRTKLTAAAGDIDASAGNAAVSGAADAFGTAWDGLLGTLEAQIDQHGGSLDGASTHYDRTDRTVIPGAPR